MGVIYAMYIEYFSKTVKWVVLQSSSFRGNFTVHLNIQLSRTMYGHIGAFFNMGK